MSTLRLIITQPNQGFTLLIGGGGDCPEPGTVGWPSDYPDAKALIELKQILLQMGLLATAAKQLASAARKPATRKTAAAKPAAMAE